MPRANLPPGCSSLAFEDGTRYKAGRPGGHVEVAGHHAEAINRLSGNGDAGLVSAKGAHYLGTKRGRWCATCRVPGSGVVGGVPYVPSDLGRTEPEAD